MNLLAAATSNENDKAEKNIAFKIMLNLNHSFQRLTVYW